MSARHVVAKMPRKRMPAPSRGRPQLTIPAPPKASRSVTTHAASAALIRKTGPSARKQTAHPTRRPIAVPRERKKPLPRHAAQRATNPAGAGKTPTSRRKMPGHPARKRTTSRPAKESELACRGAIPCDLAGKNGAASAAPSHIRTPRAAEWPHSPRRQRSRPGCARSPCRRHSTIHTPRAAIRTRWPAGRSRSGWHATGAQ